MVINFGKISVDGNPFINEGIVNLIPGGNRQAKIKVNFVSEGIEKDVYIIITGSSKVQFDLINKNPSASIRIGGFNAVTGNKFNLRVSVNMARVISVQGCAGGQSITLSGFDHDSYLVLIKRVIESISH